MIDFAYVFTVFFSLMGPVKLIVNFAGETDGFDVAFKRAVAVRATLISGATVIAVAICSNFLIWEYDVSIEALMLAGGTVLLLTALNSLLGQAKPKLEEPGNVLPLDFSFGHVATKLIVTPPAIAAILILMMLANEYPNMPLKVAIALTIIVGLNFLAMYYNAQLLKVPAALMVLKIVASVLIFMQVCLSIDTILAALARLDLVPEVQLV